MTREKRWDNSSLVLWFVLGKCLVFSFDWKIEVNKSINNQKNCRKLSFDYFSISEERENLSFHEVNLLVSLCAFVESAICHGSTTQMKTQSKLSYFWANLYIPICMCPYAYSVIVLAIASSSCTSDCSLTPLPTRRQAKGRSFLKADDTYIFFFFCFFLHYRR